MEDVCGTIFTRINDFEDHSGCLKPSGHYGAHVCRTKQGGLMQWEDDYECTCGCWDDEDDFENCCKTYSPITEQEFKNQKI